MRDFLAFRGLNPAEGDPDDPPERDTITGIGNRKNQLLLRRLEQRGADVYPGSIAYLHAVRAAGLAVAVVTASANAEAVLRAVEIAHLVQARIDGVVAGREGLRGKPAPDTFLAGARALGVEPTEAAVFEDALSGVAAGRAGGFRLVVGGRGRARRGATSPGRRHRRHRSLPASGIPVSDPVDRWRFSSGPLDLRRLPMT